MSVCFLLKRLFLTYFLLILEKFVKISIECMNNCNNVTILGKVSHIKAVY